MSRLFKYIVIFFIFLSASNAFAEEKHESIKKTDKSSGVSTIREVKPSVILDIIEEDTEPELTLEEKFIKIIETGKEFNDKLEGDKLYGDFTEELAEYFPNDNPAQLFEKQKNIRSIMEIYRSVYKLYDEIKTKILVPEEPPLIVDDEDYDTGYHADYIDAPTNQFVLVEDFKKVLAYGSDPRDIDAREAKRKRDLENKKDKTRMEELWVTMSKVDWKNTLFGSTPTDSPFTLSLGGGEWSRKDNIRVRILADRSKIDDKEGYIYMLFSVRVNDGYFVKASSLDNNEIVNIDFSNSTNLEEYEIFYLAPNKFDKGENRFIVNGGLFAIPFKVKVTDLNKNLELLPSIKFNLCNFNLECNEVELNPRLELAKGEALPSQYENYIHNVHRNIPKDHNKNIQIVSLSSGELTNGERILRVVIKNDYNLSNFDIFIESPDGIETYRPRVAMDGRKIVVRASLKDQSADIVGKDFQITVVINKFYTLRKVITATDTSIFDTINEKLSIPLILMAVLGGFILNFMPCVFPVLSIKLMSLNKVGAREYNKIKRSFYYTAFGIWFTFFILALILCLVKYLGYSIGWGMQFQNPIFLIFMMFMICVFIGVLFDFQKISQPQWMNNLMFRNKDENSLLYFITGVLAVIMATPCTAPYLGTTIGFALAGSYTDIIIILMAVAVGLSLPYVFFASLPYLAVFVPKPGKWMNQLNSIMVLMLVLTLIWLVSIYYAQTNGWAAFRMIIYLLFFTFVLWFKDILIKVIETTIMDKDSSLRLKKLFSSLASVVAILILSLSIFDGYYNFARRKQDVLEFRERKIDMDLINSYVNEGKIVLVNIQADWCLTCMYNDMTVLSNIFVERLMEKENVVVINVDWTTYDSEVLNFMEKYGRKGLPFYVIFSKNIPDGLVLPELLNEVDFMKVINNIVN